MKSQLVNAIALHNANQHIHRQQVEELEERNTDLQEELNDANERIAELEENGGDNANTKALYEQIRENEREKDILQQVTDGWKQVFFLFCLPLFLL